MNATASDSPSATPRTLRFSSDTNNLLPGKTFTTETVEATFANAVMSLPDNIRTSEQVKKDASDYTKLLLRTHLLKDKLKRFSDEEFIPHAARIRIELKGPKSVANGPNGQVFGNECSALALVTHDYMLAVKESMRKVALWSLQEAKRDLCNFACNYAIDIIAARIIDYEHAESSDKVQMELIFSILKDLMSTHRETRHITTLMTGTNTPVRVTTSGPATDSKLTPLLFEIEYGFKSPPQKLTEGDTNKFAVLLTTTSQDMHDIFVATIAADNKRILWEKKALEKSKLLARINTTTLVEDTSKETENFMANMTAETLDELIEKRLEKRLREEAKKAKLKAKQSTSSSSNKTDKDKEKEKKLKQKKKNPASTASTASAKKAKGAASSPASSKKKPIGGKKNAKPGTEAPRQKSSGAGNKKDTKKRNASEKSTPKSKKRNNAT